MGNEIAPTAVYNLVGLVMILIFIIGLVLNGFVILIFRTIYDESKTCTNLLILSISYCNLFHVLSYPLNIISSFQKQWGFGLLVCRLDAFWVHWMAITSVAHLTMLAIDRYLSVRGNAIVRSSRYRYMSMFGCWFYGFLWSVLPLVGWSDYGFEGMGISCSAKFGSAAAEDISYDIALFLTDFILPLVIIIISYAGIYHHIRVHNEAIFGGCGGVPGSQAGMEMEKKLITIVVMMVVAFTISWTPYAIACFVMMALKNTINPIAATLPAIIAKSSPCYFPIVYALKHGAVQRG